MVIPDNCRAQVGSQNQKIKGLSENKGRGGQFFHCKDKRHMTKANRVVSFRSILSRRRYIGTHLQEGLRSQRRDMAVSGRARSLPKLTAIRRAGIAICDPVGVPCFNAPDSGLSHVHHHDSGWRSHCMVVSRPWRAPYCRSSWRFSFSLRRVSTLDGFPKPKPQAFMKFAEHEQHSISS